jgi:glycine/D-amino acid oxidase-like deaminating enzyme
MTTHHYDVIVVGARCAGSPTAMLLAHQRRRDVTGRNRYRSSGRGSEYQSIRSVLFKTGQW